MILRSIAVEGWRCFANPVEVRPFDEGVNVLYAPNGSGKSTLFEALRRAFTDWYRVSGQDAEAMRPWGRQLAPTVTVEFAHGGVEYRLRKRFLDRPFAGLDRQEDGRFVPLAQDDAVDDHLREMLRQKPPGRGLARPENWGLAQILWVPQGRLGFEGLSGDLVTDIRRSLGAQVSTGAASRLEKRTEEVYARYFTPTGKRRTGKDASPVVSLEQQLAAAKDREGEALARFQQYEATARRVEELRARRAQARRDAEALSKALTEARRRAEQYRALRDQRGRQKTQAEREEARYDALRQRIKDIQETTQNLEKTDREVEELRGTVQRLAREVEARDQEASKAKADLENVQAERGRLEQMQREAEQAARYAQCLKNIQDLDARLARIAEASEALAQRKRERAAWVAPDAKTLRAIRKALNEREAAQKSIEGALITLEIVPLAATSLTVLAGEEPGEKVLAAGLPARLQGSPEVVAELPGLGRIRASGPVESVEAFRTQRDEAARKLAQLTEGFPSADLEELEARSDRANELEQCVAQAETELKTLLAGEQPEDLEQERAKLAQVQAQILEAFPGWAGRAPDVAALQEAARAARREYETALAGAQGAWERAREAREAAAHRHTAERTRLEEREKQHRSLRVHLDGLTSDGKTPEQREAESKAVALAWEAARSALGETERLLAEFPDDPADTAERLERQLQAAEQAATEALEKEKTEEGKLAQLAAQGPYSALAQAQEEAAKLARELERETAREAAVRLLQDTVKQCRSEALAAVAGPVEAAATRLFRRIAGRRLGPVRFADAFQPAHVEPELAGGAVSVEEVSGGEKEQIFLATRLALAEVLARQERQLVVLDDILLATDAARLARVMAVLEEAAQRLQIAILTCHPERYGGLRGARFLDLESLAGVPARVT